MLQTRWDLKQRDARERERERDLEKRWNNKVAGCYKGRRGREKMEPWFNLYSREIIVYYTTMLV